ncbi:MAG TPA: outer membrane lipoprotein carrier protein LolA [Sphingomonadaceae bacterium]|nr:outer membrane lipoprotein carrier protein LolA [Sphingomonadaceae bacterium]
MNRNTPTFRALSRPVMAALLAAAVPAAMIAPAIPAAAADARIDRAVAALRGISTLKADFVQTDRNGQRVTGVLTLKRPGKIRFEYEEAVNVLIVSNGSSLNFIDYDVRQVERWPIKNSPLGALLDPNRDVAQYGSLVPTNSPDVISIEVRDPDKPEFGMMNLIFVSKPSAPGGLELVSWVQLDAQNKRTTVRLTNHRYGVSVPESTFRWRDPRVTTRRPG